MSADVAGRSRATIAVFAYNQEHYVREAIAGAFAQTYQPLEIILSDDCSTDRTFAIMQEMAAAYDGPHRVITRRSPANAGIIDHLLAVAKEAEGELLVIAAGDDIPLPDRVAELVESGTRTGAAALYSACEIIDSTGKVTSAHFLPEPMAEIQRIFAGTTRPLRHGGLVRNIPGYSAAYRTTLLSSLPLCGTGAHNEDALLTFLVNLQGEHIEAVDKPLMKYRVHDGSVSTSSNAVSIESFMARERKIHNFSRSTLAFFAYFESLLAARDFPDGEIVFSRIQYQRILAETVVSFWNSPGLLRPMLLFKRRDARSLKYLLPRLLGLRIFVVLRYLAHRFRI